MRSWIKEDDLNHSRQLIDEYELLLRQSGVEEDEMATTAVVELGVATVVQCGLQDKQATTRRGSPTVRCSYMSAAATSVVPAPRVSTAPVSDRVCGQAVLSSAVDRAVATSDPCVVGWNVERSRAVAQAWIDGTKPIRSWTQASNRLSPIHHSQPPKPSG